MKVIVALLLVLIGCSAAAQTAKPAVMDTAFVDPAPIQIEPVAVPAFDFTPNSETGVVAVNSIPGAPSPMPITASIRAITSPRSKDFESFRLDRFNRMLVANEFLLRGFDALSTYNRLNDPCGCYREATHWFGLDMTPMLKHAAGAYSYSFGVATAYSFISAKLWDAGKDHPRRARLFQRLSRALLIGDSSMEFIANVHNLSMHAPPGDQRQSGSPRR